MQDHALDLLLEKWRAVSEQGNSLWFADENSHEILPQLAQAGEQMIIVSNRYDIHTFAQKLGLRSFLMMSILVWRIKNLSTISLFELAKKNQ